MYVTVILFLVNFFRTIFIIAVVYFVIRLFSRLVLPYLVQKGVKNMQQNMDDQYRSQQRSGRHEGDVTIEKNQRPKKNNSRDEGEYIDFEEVE